MAEFSVNPTRFDPYKNFKFRIKWDGRHVAGVSKISENNKVWSLGAGRGAEVSLKDFRKDIVLELYNEAGQLVLAYKVYRCWVSEYEILPNLDANANAIAIEHIKLENEGWERDRTVKEPVESSSKKS